MFKLWKIFKSYKRNVDNIVIINNIKSDEEKKENEKELNIYNEIKIALDNISSLIIKFLLLSLYKSIKNKINFSEKM